MTPPPGMPAERWTRLIDVCRQMDDRANRGAGPPRPDHDGPCIPWAAADSFACPCLVCPCCGWINDDPEQTHPEDGLAGPCGRCRYFEWWAVSGPHRDGRHMHSETERDEWNAYDTAVMEGRA